MPLFVTSLLESLEFWQIALGAVSLIVLCIFGFLYQLYIYPLYVSPLRHAPGPEYGHYLFGQMPKIIESEAGIIQREWMKKHGDSRGIVRAMGPFGLERMIFMSAEAQQKILVSDWLDYPRPGFMRNILGLVAGFGLLTVTGDRHRRMRKFMNPAFSISNLMAQTDMYYDPIYTLVKILQKSINESEDRTGGKEFDMYPYMSKVTLDIICLTAFGYDANSLENPDNELASAYEELINLQSGANLASMILLCAIPGFMSIIQSEWLFKHRHWFRSNRYLGPLMVLLESMRRIKAVSADLLKDKLEESSGVTASDNTTKKDIMSLLVRARTNELKTEDLGVEKSSRLDSYHMSDNEMMDQVLTFLGAGHETTASGLAWTLWLLATHPQVQDRLRVEVTKLLERNPTPDYRSLKECEWLDCVIMESLRLFPPVPMTVRKAGKSDWIDGIYVPKNTLFYIPIRVTNQWQEIWGADAEEFKPERWLDLPPKYHSSFSFQTFIAGPHACIGRTMAIIEMKAIIAIFIAHFAVERAYPDQKAKPTAAVTMKPADNLPLRVKSVRPCKF